MTSNLGHTSFSLFILCCCSKFHGTIRLALSPFLLWLGLSNSPPYLPLSNKPFKLLFHYSCGFRKFSFIYLVSHPELPLPFTFLRDTSDMMIYLERPVKLLFSAHLLVQQSFLEPPSLQKDRGKQREYCTTLRKSLSTVQCSGFYYWGMQHQTLTFICWNLTVLILRMHNCNNSVITLLNNIIKSKKMLFSLWPL